MPYTVRHLPVRGKPSWAKVNRDTGRITSRHQSKAKARASVRVYRVTRNILVANARNPLRMDPTRTTLIRRRFVADMRRRFRKLKKDVNEFMVTLDALGLKDRHSFLTGNQPQPREFEFRTDAGKVSAFNEWFRQQVEADVLSVPAGTPAGQPWTAKYVESGYRRGLANSYIASRQADVAGELGVLDQSQEAFLRSAFLQPETVSKVQLLATRSFEQLRGVTSQMGADMNRILAQGMADGRGPRAIAKEMTDRIDSMTRTRATVIARTEVINAHAEGQLDAFEELGVEEVGVKAEWSTAGDDRVCPDCAGMEGQVFDMKEARGMIPLHPQCRCAWIPAEEGAKATGVAGIKPPSDDLFSEEGKYDEFINELHPGGFTDDETDMVQAYSDNAFLDMNAHLRHGTPIVEEDNDWVPGAISRMDSMMDKSYSPRRVLLYRGIDERVPIEQLKPGVVIEDRAFVSSSAKLDTAAGFVGKRKELMEIVAPGGSQMISVTKATGNVTEQEFILNRGSRFLVTDKVEERKYTRNVGYETIDGEVVRKQVVDTITVRTVELLLD